MFISRVYFGAISIISIANDIINVRLSLYYSHNTSNSVGRDIFFMKFA